MVLFTLLAAYGTWICCSYSCEYAHTLDVCVSVSQEVIRGLTADLLEKGQRSYKSLLQSSSDWKRFISPAAYQRMETHYYSIIASLSRIPIAEIVGMGNNR